MDRSLFTSFGLRENPFSVNPDPRQLFVTQQIQKAFGDMTAGIQSRQGLILLTGDVGTGKTTLINYLLAWLQREGTPKALIVNSHLEASELFELMLADFGVPGDGQGRSAFARLNAWLLELHRAGRTAVLVIDEAQGLPSYTLEEIRLLLNLETPKGKLLQIILSGQPEFEQKLRRTELRQIQQRVAIRCRTAPLTREEARDCIQQRLRMAGAEDGLIFSPEAMDAAYFYSRGIPRVINLLCEHALLKAFASGARPVSASLIEEASRELQFDSDRPVTPLRGSEVSVPRANLISMQAVPNKPAMAFAAAAGSSAQRHEETKNIKVLDIAGSATAERSPVDKAAMQSSSRGYVASIARKADPLAGMAIPAQNGQESVQRGSAANWGFADVGQIIAELGRAAAVGTPVRINSAGIRKTPAPAAIARREIAAVRVKAAGAMYAFGAKWKAEAEPRIRASVARVGSYGRRLSRQCAAKGFRFYTRITSASPAFARVTSSFIFWLKEPVPIGPVIRGNTKIHAGSEEDGRFSGLNNMLWEKAEPILRWLQAPVRSPQRR